MHQLLFSTNNFFNIISPVYTNILCLYKWSVSTRTDLLFVQTVLLVQTSLFYTDSNFLHKQPSTALTVFLQKQFFSTHSPSLYKHCFFAQVNLFLFCTNSLSKDKQLLFHKQSFLHKQFLSAQAGIFYINCPFCTNTLSLYKWSVSAQAAFYCINSPFCRNSFLYASLHKQIFFVQAVFLSTTSSFCSNSLFCTNSTFWNAQFFCTYSFFTYNSFCKNFLGAHSSFYVKFFSSQTVFFVHIAFFLKQTALFARRIFFCTNSPSLHQISFLYKWFFFPTSKFFTLSHFLNEQCFYTNNPSLYKQFFGTNSFSFRNKNLKLC